MPTHTITEAAARPLRTAGQGGLGWIVTELIDAFAWDLTDRQYGVLVLAFGVLFSFVQTTVENRTGKALLRTIPPRRAEVVDGGHVDLATALLVGVLALVLLVVFGVWSPRC